MIKVLATVILVAVALALTNVLGARRRAGATSRALSSPTGGQPSPDEEQLPTVLAFLRRRPWVRRGMSGVSALLLVAAVALLAYPFYTNLYQARVQQRLSHQLTSPALQQAYRSRSLGTGDALTRIRIPAINVDVVVVEGTTASALRAGAGHYPGTPLPCESGNVGIAGHRTTYGRPFHNLDRLKEGDEIILETPIGQCTYKVARAPFVVLPDDSSVVAPSTSPVLTLTTCHPKGSASHRLVVRAALQGSPTSA
jgi:sortase A